MKENSADLGLLDVRGIGFDQLLSEPDDSAFRRALDRIMSPSCEASIGGFQANI